MTLLLQGRIATGGSVVEGWLELDRGRIVAAGDGQPPRVPDERPDGIIAPGLCDLQVNGAAGHEVTAGGKSLDVVDAVQLAHGVTSYLPTVVPADDEAAAAAVEELAARAADPASPVAGIHLEGPFLAREHRGMYEVDHLRAPDEGIPGYFDSPAVRLVTLAPELPGALELIAALHRRGVAVALGHSGASAAVAQQAFEAGAGMVTHLFNAMAPLHHREPGLVGAGLVHPRVRIGVVADGVHLHPLVLELIRRAAGPRVVLVSDSSPAAAAAPGRHRFAGTDVDAAPDGAVRTPDGRLAGSALTLDRAVGNWARMTGATLAESIQAAAETPASALSRSGGLRPGRPADLALLDDAGAVRRVMRHGRWLD